MRNLRNFLFEGNDRDARFLPTVARSAHNDSQSMLMGGLTAGIRRTCLHRRLHDLIRRPHPSL